jgi:hypothetical protein
VAANGYKLVYGYQAGQNYIIPDGYMSGQGGIVGKNTVVAHKTIMCHMAIGHYKAIVPDNGFHSIRCAFVYCGTFPYGGIVADYDGGFLTFIL